MNKNRLWTFDFTVITIGSVVSMAGSALVSFALSLLVLDYTGSTFLYILFDVCVNLPMLVFPALAGPYLDRVSRKKVIYTLDFVSAGYYLLLFVLLRSGWFSYPLLLAGGVFTGVIGSIYSVAYESFYPNLVPEGGLGKAYAIGSLLGDLAAMAYPLGAVLYNWLGSAAPIFAIHAACCFIAACFERSIRFQEKHMAPARPAVRRGPRFRRDFREGLDYLRGERGLLMIALYFMVTGFCDGADSLRLPFFRSNAQLYAAWPVAAVTLYAIVTNFDLAGRLAGGVLQYRIRYPMGRKFDIALGAYIAVNLLGGAMLFLPIPLMAAASFAVGVLGVTSYTIRTSATQAYVPDGKRARFNGMFRVITAAGSIAGSLTAGALAEVLPERTVMVMAFSLAQAAVYAFIWRGREQIRAIYNRTP